MSGNQKGHQMKKTFSRTCIWIGFVIYLLAKETVFREGLENY